MKDKGGRSGGENHYVTEYITLRRFYLKSGREERREEATKRRRGRRKRGGRRGEYWN